MIGKTLQAHVRLGMIRHLFTADDLDPINAPALALTRDELKRKLIQFAADPDGFFKQFDETVAELRAEFAKKDPRLRVRYAAGIQTEQDQVQ